MYTGKYYSVNKKLLCVSSWVEPNMESVYEVLRIINGKPLFWNDHYKRLMHSLQLNGVELSVTQNDVIESLHQLVKQNGLLNTNLRLDIQYTGSRVNNVVLAQTKPMHITKQQYAHGVKACMVTEERPNPNAKNVITGLRQRIADVIQKKHVWEVLLVNHHNQVTEGSRTNVFFVKNNEVFTPPVSQVLIGITRQRILDICHELGIKTTEAPIYKDEVSSFDHVFFSGTTPGAILVSHIGEQKFSVESEVYRQVMQGYKKRIEKDLLQFSSYKI